MVAPTARMCVRFRQGHVSYGKAISGCFVYNVSEDETIDNLSMVPMLQLYINASEAFGSADNHVRRKYLIDRFQLEPESQNLRF